MTALAIVLGVVALAGAGGALALGLAALRHTDPPGPWAEHLERRRVLANLSTGEAIRGVLLEEDRGVFVFVEAELLAKRGATVAATPLDGTVVIARELVTYTQVLPPAPPARLASANTA